MLVGGRVGFRVSGLLDLGVGDLPTSLCSTANNYKAG